MGAVDQLTEEMQGDRFNVLFEGCRNFGAIGHVPTFGFVNSRRAQTIHHIYY